MATTLSRPQCVKEYSIIPGYRAKRALHYHYAPNFRWYIRVSHKKHLIRLKSMAFETVPFIQEVFRSVRQDKMK